LPAALGDLEDAQLSPDGRWLVLTTRRVDDYDIRARSIVNDSVIDIATTPGFAETAATFSPDGKWVAYVSTETGRPEVYVRPFPDVARERRQVSSAGGYSPAWSRDGSELFYIAQNDWRLFAIPVTSRSPLTFGIGHPLFSAASFEIYTLFHGFAPMPDGRSFLLERPAQRASSVQPVMVFNWLDELKAKAARR
jgi:serine/threonine-protein kinase